ncbi:hypothetical protein PBY51_014797 [Eleginops maclovinus]|uniref:Uncharacterized protein n=1 Tax=Eleginops maclovinus TaxID=56733 RepID=A0AAN8AB98_ELEMC|nr:hypothetical protein PBY51_014797 [Eleginops maclovinus]
MTTDKESKEQRGRPFCEGSAPQNNFLLAAPSEPAPTYNPAVDTNPITPRVLNSGDYVVITIKPLPSVTQLAFYLYSCGQSLTNTTCGSSPPAACL